MIILQLVGIINQLVINFMVMFFKIDNQTLTTLALK